MYYYSNYIPCILSVDSMKLIYGTLLSKYPDAVHLTTVLLYSGSPGIVRVDDADPIPVTLTLDGIVLEPLMYQLIPTRVSLTEQ